jgi:hypothetical protein
MNSDLRVLGVFRFGQSALGECNQTFDMAAHKISFGFGRRDPSMAQQADRQAQTESLTLASVTAEFLS